MRGRVWKLFIVAAIAGVAYAVLMLRREEADPHIGARDDGYEIWLGLQPGSLPPAPSMFARWRTAFGETALLRAIRDVAERNRLTKDLVNRVLLLRSEAAYVTVEESLTAEERNQRWLGAA
jgi:hypothetical protein